MKNSKSSLANPALPEPVPLILLTGGIRSGKSRYALELAKGLCPSGGRAFIATAEALDGEMKARISRHQEERGADFTTFEEPLRLAEKLRDAQKEHAAVVVDCLTLWVNNLLYYFAKTPEKMQVEIADLLLESSRKKTPVIFVTNEVGLGLVPDNPLGRRFVDELGGLNAKLAAICDQVVMMVAGIPNYVKGESLVRLDA